MSARQARRKLTRKHRPPTGGLNLRLLIRTTGASAHKWIVSLCATLAIQRAVTRPKVLTKSTASQLKLAYKCASDSTLVTNVQLQVCTGS